MRLSFSPLAASCAILLGSVSAAAQVEPANAFYSMAFTHGVPHTGVITAHRTTAPFGVIAMAARGTANGALSFDPGRSLLYAGACCTANVPLHAYDPVTLARVPGRDIMIPSTGSMALEVDGPRRVLFFFDTVARTLRAVSLGDDNYGAVVASATLTDVTPEGEVTSVGDHIAVDTRAQRVVVTGGDGGPVVTVDVAAITTRGGAFGAVTRTGHVNRSTGNSGGAVAVDVAGRRIFFLPSTGTVRIVAADPPFARIADITIPSMAPNDCGLHFDSRSGNLYVGSGNTSQPVVVSFPSMTVTPFATGPGEGIALSFAAASAPCVDRDEDGFAAPECAMTGARADCDDSRRDVNPAAPEACDARDNNCNGLLDEGFCRIGGACHANDAVNPANACQRCVAPTTASAATAWSPRPAATVCRPAVGPCDLAETCDGSGDACPAERFAAAGTVCRMSSSVIACDPVERCDGEGPSCPTDVVTRAPTTEICNGSDDDCDGMIDEPPCMPMPDAGPEASADGGDPVPDAPRDVASEPPGDAAPPDVTPPPDGPAPLDATMDAAAPDVPAPDAPAPPPDAPSPPPDAPAPPPDSAAADGGMPTGASQDGGCGCTTAGTGSRAGYGSLAALLAVLLCARRRRCSRRGEARASGTSSTHRRPRQTGRGRA